MSLSQFFTCFKQNEKDTRSLLKDYHIDLFPCHTSKIIILISSLVIHQVYGIRIYYVDVNMYFVHMLTQ